jgi:hypothetical protein
LAGDFLAGGSKKMAYASGSSATGVRAGDTMKPEELLGKCSAIGFGPFVDNTPMLRSKEEYNKFYNAIYSVITEDKTLSPEVVCALAQDAYLITKQEYDVAVAAADSVMAIGGGKKYKQRGGNIRAVVAWVLGPFATVFNFLATIVKFTGNSLSYITNKLLDTISASATSGAIVNKLMEIVNAGGNVPAQIDAYYATLIAGADTANIITFIIFMSMMAGFIPTITLSGLVTSILGLLPQGAGSTLLYAYLQYINLFMLVPVEYSIVSKTLRYVGQKAAGSNKAIQAIFTKISARYDPSNIEKMYRVLYKKVTGKDYDPTQTVTYTILKPDMSTKAITLSGINPGIYNTALRFAGNEPKRVRTTKSDGTYGDEAPIPAGANAATSNAATSNASTSNASTSNASTSNAGSATSIDDTSMGYTAYGVGGRRRKHHSRRHRRRLTRSTHRKSSRRQRH